MNPIKLQTGLALLIAGCAFALPQGVRAEESKNLYKCVDAKGVVSIQAKACPTGTTTAWVRPAQTEPKQTTQDVEAARARDQHDQQQVKELSAELNRKMAEQQAAEQGRPPTPSPQPSAKLDPGAVQTVATSQCEQAQAFMAAVREKTWLGMTEDQLQRVYGWVADQCRVNTAPAAQ